TPQGLVRNPDGDFLYGFCHLDQRSKRFYLARIVDLDVVATT
ncbi:MAG: exonuclease, partial [Bdellovibrio sp.]